MKIKKYLYFLSMIFFSIVISACNDGNLITGVEIVSYPNRLFYVVGIDNELDLEGGFVQLLTRGRSEPTELNIIRMDSDRDFDVIHDIDFNVPGIYIVYIERWRYSASFPIQVVSLEEIEGIIRRYGDRDI